MKKLLLSCAVLLLVLPATAQNKGSKGVWPNQDAKRWQLGIQAGASTLLADAQELGFSYAAGFNVQYNFGHVFGVRMLANYAQFKGSETEGRGGFATYDYTNNAIDIGGQGVYSLSSVSFLRKMKKFNWYVGVGPGIMITDFSSTFRLTNDPPSSESTNTFTDMFPYLGASLGTRYNVSKGFALGLEYNARFTGSDRIDGIAYATPTNKARDFGSYLQLTANFKLGKKGKEHVEWINPVETIYEDIAKVEKKVDELSGDQDGDGVADYFDKDNETPEGAMVYGNGKAVDTDGDGVPDIKDKEPNSPANAEVDEDGKALDDDNDGVPNVNDISPNTDTAYMVNHQGIPIMTKQLARKLAPKGGLSGGGLGYMPAILFETGSSKIKPTHYADLQGIAEAIKRSTGVKILIIGNADFRGSETLNQKLALKRAEAVKQILVDSFGVSPDQIEVQSNGEKVPIAKGTDPVSLQANRRVQFFVVE